MNPNKTFLVYTKDKDGNEDCFEYSAKSESEVLRNIKKFMKRDCVQHVKEK